MNIGNIQFNTYDLGGHYAARKIWVDYCGAVDGLIYMVDSHDHDRLKTAREELEKLLAMPELAEVPIVVYGNKVDMADALSEDEFREVMGLPFHETYGRDPKNSNPGARPIEVFMCSVKKKLGYQDGFNWLSQFIK